MQFGWLTLAHSPSPDCQISFGYLAHAKLMASMRLFGEEVMPRFRREGT